MDEAIEDPRVTQELYFLIAKFLSDGPLKETAKTLLNELQTVEVLPRRLDWEGREHVQSYDDLLSKYSDVSPRRLLDVCKRAIKLAQVAFQANNLTLPNLPMLEDTPSSAQVPSEPKIETRLSLLSNSLTARKAETSPYTPGHSLPRRLEARSLGLCASEGTGDSGSALFPSRLLSNLQLQRRTLGHLSAVYCLVFDCTGRYVITGADDMLVKVWSARDGRPLAALRGAGAEITDVCVSADGGSVAAGSTDRAVRVWDLRTGAPRAVLTQHQGTITAVHWSRMVGAGGLRWLASTSTDGSVCFWPSAAGGHLSRPTQFLERMRPGQCHMICAAWSAGGGFLACGSADHYVRIYAVSDHHQPQRILESCAHTEAVDSVAWSSRGLKLVSGSKDGTAAIWQLRAAHWRHVALRPARLGEGVGGGGGGERLKCTMVCWERTDQYVIMAVSDYTLRVWCARSGSQVRVLRGHADEVYVLEAHPTLPHVFLSAGHDGQLRTWHATRGEALSVFHNEIPGQGCGAIFDAKWGSGVTIAASDSHGHLMLHGIGQGHPRFHQLPLELFFHTDYRPITRDASGAALDEQSGVPPHMLPPSLLVDVEGAPYPRQVQAMVHGEDFEEFGFAENVPPAASLPPGGAGPWRGEGVRRAGELRGAEAAGGERDVTQPPHPAVVRTLLELHRSLREYEHAIYQRELRRRPVMISTEAGGRGRGRGGARPRAQRPARAYRPDPHPEEAEQEEEEGSTDTSDASVALSDTPSDDSHSRGSSSSSSWSEWERGGAGAALAPPQRSRRRPRQTCRYSPSLPSSSRRTKARTVRATETPEREPNEPEPAPSQPEREPSRPERVPSDNEPEPSTAELNELPEVYRPGDWLTMTSPRKSPYHPQMGDECVYFRLGHERYLAAVAERDVYPLSARDRPWERQRLQEAEFIKIIGIKYVVVPPRVAQLRVVAGGAGGRRFTVKYHDVSDVIDFLVPREYYAAALAHRWGAGDRFRCLIDEHWWSGVITERLTTVTDQDTPEEVAAKQFLCLKVQWDNGEIERLSPWDLEKLDNDRALGTGKGGVPVTSAELAAMHPPAWRAASLAPLLDQVMSLSAAEAFAAPRAWDGAAGQRYYRRVPYPIDLATIRARLLSGFYRRAAGAQFDARMLASGEEACSHPRAAGVRQARLITDLLLSLIQRVADTDTSVTDVDVVAEFRALAAHYHSSDDEVLAALKSSRSASWVPGCQQVLAAVCASSDAGPFLQPVAADTAPDYHAIISEPMDLGLVRERLSRGQYSHRDQVAADVRLVFANSRRYNTNKRSRIYSMTVRLSSLFEELWSRADTERPARRRTRRNRVPPRRLRSSDNSDSEPLARRATRRSHHARHNTRHKGKGVGKRSKKQPSPSLSPELDIETFDAEAPGCSTGAALAPEDAVDSSNSELDNTIEAIDEHLLEEDEVEEEEAASHDETPPLCTRARRKRGRGSGSDDSDLQRNVRLKHEYSSASASASESESASEEASEAGAERGEASEAARHYESDRSYRPRYSSDDDRPLNTLRNRQEGASMNGARTSRVRKKRRVRARPRYNENSEDDALAAITKRARGALTTHRPPPAGAARRDHDYSRPHTNGADLHNGADAGPSREGGEGVGGGALSVSSRGRVRRLTAKARHLLRP